MKPLVSSCTWHLVALSVLTVLLQFSCATPRPETMRPSKIQLGAPLTRDRLIEYVVMLEKAIDRVMLVRSEADARTLDYEKDLRPLLKLLRQAYGELGAKRQELETIVRLVREYEQLVDADWRTYSLDYANFLSHEGYGLLVQRGIREGVPDYSAALDLYDRLIKELPASDRRAQEAQEATRRITQPRLIAHSLIGDRDGIVLTLRNIDRLDISLEDEHSNVLTQFTYTMQRRDHRSELIFIPRRTMDNAPYGDQFAAVVRVRTSQGLEKSFDFANAQALAKGFGSLPMTLPHLNASEAPGEDCGLCHVRNADGKLPQPRRAIR